MEDAFLEPKFHYKKFLMESFFLKFYKNLTAHSSLFPYTVKIEDKRLPSILKLWDKNNQFIRLVRSKNKIQNFTIDTVKKFQFRG